MSKSVVKVSDEAPDELEPVSVYDFLYHDSRRIASFLSQFDESGLLTGITQGETATRGAKRGYKVGLGGNVPLFGGGNVDFERSPGESGGESLERAYDPFWANAREFLDALDARGLIHRDLQQARIGQFVLVRGSLIIADLKMLERVWPLASVQKVMAASATAAAEPEEEVYGNRQQRMAAQAKQRKQQPKGVPDEIQMVMDILPHLPHSGQFHLIADDFAVWAPASEDALVGLMSDLVLKHGAKIAGEWAMVGILDALPYDEGDEGLTPMEMIRAGMTSDGIAKAALQLAPFIRIALGRPLLSYGVTPLLVFREIAADETSGQ